MRKNRAVASFIGALLLLGSAVPAMAQQSPRSAADCSLTSTGAVPLPDLGTETYMGEQGGLYPGGANEIPDDHLTLGLWHASQIEPMDAGGSPDPAGNIVLLSIGVSNTRSEFGTFIRNATGDTDSDVVLVNGAQPGEDVSAWQDVDARTWRNIDNALAQNDVTPEQVQAVWIKLPDIVEGRAELVPFPTNAATYRDQLAVVVQNASDRYPNLRVAYLSTRIYAGYNTSGRPSPEPLAYENAFGAKWLIEDQISGDITLNADPRRGAVEAPWLAWGPYLWADGTTGRSDGLVWACDDLQSDGIHPSQSGAAKVSSMLLTHFETDPTAAPWFLPNGTPIGEITLPTPVDPPVATTTPPATTTTTEATTTTSTTTPPDEGSERPGPPDRSEREEERAARQADNAESESNEGLLIATAVILAVVLGGIALVGRMRRDPSSDGDNGS